MNPSETAEKYRFNLQQTLQRLLSDEALAQMGKKFDFVDPLFETIAELLDDQIRPDLWNDLKNKYQIITFPPNIETALKDFANYLSQVKDPSQSLAEIRQRAGQCLNLLKALN